MSLSTTWKFSKMLSTRQESKGILTSRNSPRPNIKTIFNSSNGSKDTTTWTAEVEAMTTILKREEEMWWWIWVLRIRMWCQSRLIVGDRWWRRRSCLVRRCHKCCQRSLQQQPKHVQSQWSTSPSSSANNPKPKPSKPPLPKPKNGNNSTTHKLSATSSWWCALAWFSKFCNLMMTMRWRSLCWRK